MVTRIDESNAPTLVPQEVSRASDNGSSRLDTYRELAGLLVSGGLLAHNLVDSQDLSLDNR